jgi:type I restriction enzyme S subunit
MKAVVENFGGINIDDIQPLSRVIRGYTAFLEGDVIFAKITLCMENGKIAVIPSLKNHIGYGSTEFHVLKGTGLSYPYWLAYYLSQRSIRLLAKRNMTGKRLTESQLVL